MDGLNLPFPHHDIEHEDALAEYFNLVVDELRKRNLLEEGEPTTLKLTVEDDPTELADAMATVDPAVLASLQQTGWKATPDKAVAKFILLRTGQYLLYYLCDLVDTGKEHPYFLTKSPSGPWSLYDYESGRSRTVAENRILVENPEQKFTNRTKLTSVVGSTEKVQ